MGSLNLTTAPWSSQSMINGLVCVAVCCIIARDMLGGAGVLLLLFSSVLLRIHKQLKFEGFRRISKDFEGFERI